MSLLVKQSTTQLPLFFFLVLSSDHISPATGLAGSVTVTISKNGAAFAAPAGAITEISGGWYQVAGNATDTNTLGAILLHATQATTDNCDMVVADVVAFDPTNANLGITNVSANVAQWNGTNVAVPATAGIPDVNVKNYNNVVAQTDANSLPKMDVEDITGVAVSAHAAGMMPSDVRDIVGVAVSTSTAQLGVNVVNIAGVVASLDANNLLKVDVEDVGGVVLSTHAAGMMPSDLRDIAGAVVNTATAQIGANMVNIAGSAVSTTSAQIGTNVVNIAGQAAALDANNLLKVDMEDINGNALAAQALRQSTNTIVWGTCSGGSTITAIVSSMNNPSLLTATGQLIGRTIIFLGSTSSGGLQSQASNITNSTTGATPTITFTALTNAVAAGDTFVVI